MLTDAKLCSSIAELLALRLLGVVGATLLSVICMAATFGKNVFSAAIDDKSMLLSITTSPAIDMELDAVEVVGSSLEAVATLTLL